MSNKTHCKIAPFRRLYYGAIFDDGLAPYVLGLSFNKTSFLKFYRIRDYEFICLVQLFRLYFPIDITRSSKTNLGLFPRQSVCLYQDNM